MMDCYQKAADWLHWVLVFTFSTKKDHMRFIFKIVVLILVLNFKIVLSFSYLFSLSCSCSFIWVCTAEQVLLNHGTRPFHPTKGSGSKLILHYPINLYV